MACLGLRHSTEVEFTLLTQPFLNLAQLDSLFVEQMDSYSFTTHCSGKVRTVLEVKMAFETVAAGHI